MSLDDTSVRYAQHCVSRAEVLDMLPLWSARLADLRPGQVIYLPFSFDEEYVEAFEVEQHGAQLSLRVVSLDGGCILGIDPRDGGIARDRPVVKRAAQAILLCERNQLIDAVARAIARG